jgi:HSP20 family protein
LNQRDNCCLKGLIRPSKQQLSRWFNSPIDRFFGNDFFDLWNGDKLETLPSLNITEEKNNYLIELAAPGLKKEDFNIDVQGNVVTISCDKETEHETNETDFLRREYDFTSFSRSFTLPETADPNKIHAKYIDGVLHLEIPKRPETLKEKTQKIKVE